MSHRFLKVYLNELLKKMWESGKIKAKPAKPDSGQILSGKFFSMEFAQFNTEFDEPSIYAIDNGYVLKVLRCLIEPQQLSSC